MKPKGKTTSNLVEGQNFTDSFSAEEDVFKPGVYASQLTYALLSEEFSQLLADDSKASKIIDKFLTASIGYFLIIIAKYVSTLFGANKTIENWELIVGLLAIILFLVLRFIAPKIFPSKRNETISRIQQFYKENPVKLQTRQ